MKKKKQTIVVRWNNVLLEAIRRTGAPPPRAARSSAIVHTCMYDAWACYHERALGTRLGGRLRRPVSEQTKENREEAISFAAYRALKDQFDAYLKPEHKKMFEEMMLSLGYDPNDGSENKQTPAGIGNFTAKMVLEYRKGDGANQAGNYGDYTGFSPPYKPGDAVPDMDSDKWIPLEVDKNGHKTVQLFLLPHWGLVEPFAMPFGSYFRPLPPPAAWNSVTLAEEIEQVRGISEHLNNRQKAITEYWMDGPGSETPPGHWQLLAQYISKRDGHGIGKDIKMYFALANAVFDAGIAAWDCKFKYYYVRPITALRRKFAGRIIKAWGGSGNGTQEIDGKNWLPYQKSDFLTPPFPEFVSGHSTFSAASAEILKRFTGSDYFGMVSYIEHLNIDNRDLPDYVKLEWTTFSQAAEEAGLSRIYGGIHFREGNVKGLELGRKVADCVWDKCEALWNGKI